MKLCQETLAPGDIVTIADEYGIPKEFRLRPAIVKEVHPTFATVAVLTSNKRTSKGELWPSFKSLLGPADRRFRLGARVRLVGLHGRESSMNGACGEIVLDSLQKHHPLWRNKPGTPAPILTVAVKLDGHPDPYWIYPRYLEEEGEEVPEITEPTNLEPEAPEISSIKNKMDVDATKSESETTTTTTATVSAAEEQKVKGTQLKDSESRPISRSTTATTTAGTANNFELPDWIISFSSRVDACVAEIQERQNRLQSMTTAELEAEEEAVPLPVRSRSTSTGTPPPRSTEDHECSFATAMEEEEHHQDESAQPVTPALSVEDSRMLLPDVFQYEQGEPTDANEEADDLADRLRLLLPETFQYDLEAQPRTSRRRQEPPSDRPSRVASRETFQYGGIEADPQTLLLHQRIEEGNRTLSPSEQMRLLLPETFQYEEEEEEKNDTQLPFVPAIPEISKGAAPAPLRSPQQWFQNLSTFLKASSTGSSGSPSPSTTPTPTALAGATTA